MPNRIIRSELLDSEAWLSLKGNEDRCAYLALLLTVDNFGDLPAGPHRLVRLWRPFGIDSPEKSAKCLGDLADCDLIRRYEVAGKPYLHVPRFGQRMRYTKHAWPLSPWATIEDKQQVAKISPATSGESPRSAAKNGKESDPVDKKDESEKKQTHSEKRSASSGYEVEVEVNKPGVKGLVVPPPSRARASPQPNPDPKPETPLDTPFEKIGTTIETLTRTPNGKTPEDIERERERQLTEIAKRLKS